MDFALLCNGTTALFEGVMLIILVKKCKCKKFPCLPLVHFFLISVASNQCNLSVIAPFQVFMARICNFISILMKTLYYTSKSVSHILPLYWLIFLVHAEFSEEVGHN